MATLRSSDSSSHFHLQTEDRLEKAQQSPLISPAVVWLEQPVISSLFQADLT